MEHERKADELEREVEAMEQHSAKLGDRIDETRREWEAQSGDPAVPGAQPSAEEDPAREGDPDPSADEDPAREGGPDLDADEDRLPEEGGA